MSVCQFSEIEIVRGIIVRMNSICEHNSFELSENSASFEEILPPSSFQCLYLFGLSHEDVPRGNFAISNVLAEAKTLSAKLDFVLMDFREEPIYNLLYKLDTEKDPKSTVDNMDGSISATIFYSLEKFLVLLTVVDGLGKYSSLVPYNQDIVRIHRSLRAMVDFTRRSLRERYLKKICGSFQNCELLLEAFYGWKYRDRISDASAISAKEEIAFYESKLVEIRTALEPSESEE